MTEAAIAISLGGVVGLVLGLTGAGGAILAVPLLMWGMHWTLPQAAPVALVAVAVSAAIGTVAAWDVAVIRYRAAALMSAAGMLFSPFGLIAADILPVHLLTGVFAAVLVVVAVRMFRTTMAKAATDEAETTTTKVCMVKEDDQRIAWNKPCFAAIIGTGGLTGFLSGLLGVGGGFVIVPALRSVTALSMHAAVATSLMAVSLTSAGTVAVALAQGKHLPVIVALPFVGGAVVGMLIGRRLAPKLAGARLQRGFASLLAIVAAAMLAQAVIGMLADLHA